LTRKIFNKYENNPDKIKETIDRFSRKERQWMLDTRVLFRAIVDGRRISY